MDIVKFHTEYEHIHPFQDGNGRTGRTIILKQCLDSNIVPVIISDDKKMQYYHSLQMAQVDGNYDDLFKFFKEEQSEYYAQVRRYVYFERGKLSKMTNEQAWNFAIGLAQLDGIKVSDDFLELVEREKRGEITSGDIRLALIEKYKVKEDENDG